MSAAITRRLPAAALACAIGVGGNLVLATTAQAFDPPAIVSVDGSGAPGSAASGDGLHDLDRSGDFVVFSSAAALTPGDPNTTSDVYVRDLAGAATQLASSDASGASIGVAAYNPVFAGNAESVVFEGKGAGAVGPFDGSPSNVWLRTSAIPGARPMLATIDALPPDGESIPWSMSDDGRWIAITSAASNLDVVSPSSTDSIADVYVLDRDADADGVLDESQFALVPVSVAGDGGPTDGGTGMADMSADGRFIVWASTAGNLISGFTPACGVCFQVYGVDRDPDGDGIFDESPPSIELLSGTVATPLTGQALDPTVANDGTVAFVTHAPEFGASTGDSSVVVRAPGGTTEVIRSAAGPSLSDDADRMTYVRPSGEVWVVDRSSTAAEPVSLDWAGGVVAAFSATISGDGSAASWASEAFGLPGAGTRQVYATTLGVISSGTDCASELGALVAGYGWFLTNFGVAPSTLGDIHAAGLIGFDPSSRWVLDVNQPATILGVGDCAGAWQVVGTVVDCASELAMLLTAYGQYEDAFGLAPGGVGDLYWAGYVGFDPTVNWWLDVNSPVTIVGQNRCGGFGAGVDPPPDCATELAALAGGFARWVATYATTPSLTDLFTEGLVAHDPDPRWILQLVSPTSIIGVGDCAGSIAPVSVPVPGDTPGGTWVPVVLAPWSVRFQFVSVGGVSVAGVPGGGLPGLPAGSTLVGDAVEITTTALTSGDTRVCVDHGGVAGEPGLRLLQVDGSGAGWIDITRTNRPDANLVCGSAAGLGTFALIAGPMPNLLGSGTTEQVSVSSDEVGGNARSANSVGDAGVSSDGRYIAFSSLATNLAGGGDGTTQHVYRRDVVAGETIRVSPTGGGYAFAPSVSGDGRYVTYSSVVNPDVLVRLFDADTAATSTIGVGRESDISTDGRWVVFESYARLTADDIDNVTDIYVHDRDSDGDGIFDESGGTGLRRLTAGNWPKVSPNGRFVLFGADFTTYVLDRDGDGNGVFDDTPSDVTLVNASPTGAPGNDGSGRGDVADNGDVAFWTSATNVGDPSGVAAAVVRDFATGEISIVGTSISNTQHISADGRYVAFDSWSTNGAPDDANNAVDAFVHDRRTGVTRLVSVATDGTQPVSSYVLGMSADGTSVVWGTAFPAAPTDINGTQPDAYVRRLDPIDIDGDGVPDSLECTPDVAGAICDGDGIGSSAQVLANSTGAPVTVVDLPAPDGFRVDVGGTSGTVTIAACGTGTVSAWAGASLAITCGSISLTVFVGPVSVVPDGERQLVIQIPAGVTARISSPVDGWFTVEVLAGAGYVWVDDPEDPYGYTSYVGPGDGPVAFSNAGPPRVTSLSLSSANVRPGDQVDLTVEFEDAPGPSHTCEITWEDGLTLAGTLTGATCASSHTYATTGRRSIQVRIAASDGQIGFGGGSVQVLDQEFFWTFDEATSFDLDGASSALGVDVDPTDGSLWIVHNDTHAIAKYTADGTKLFEIGGFGTAPGKFNSPSVVAVAPNGDAYITDVGGNRVQRFDPAGSYLGSFSGGPTAFENPLGIDVDGAGNVWVADVYGGFVRKYSPTGVYLSTLGGTGTAPYAVSVDDDGYVWVSDFENGRDRVHKIDPLTGGRLTTITGLGQPVDIAFTDGHAHIVDFNSSTIKTYTRDGQLVDTRPVPVVHRPPAYYASPTPYRVAVDAERRLVLTNSSQRVLRFDPPAVRDADGDGVDDTIDTGLGTFSDGTTSGAVISGDVFVEDLVDGGVRIVAASAATIRICGFTVRLTAGTDAGITCGSVTVHVVAGGAQISGDDGLYTVSVPAGGIARVDGGDGEPITVENLGELQVIWSGTDGIPVVVEPGGSDTPNTAPSITVAGPAGPLAVGSLVEVTVSIDDPDQAEVLSCQLDWGVGTASSVVAEDGRCSFTGDDLPVGVHDVAVTVSDREGATDHGEVMVVVYDPNGGFVTGGGWFESPAGALASDPDASGRANFGFVSKYQKGTSVPAGNTQFRFQAGDLDFHSTSYEWLVVVGSDFARFKGTGTIEGEGRYTFMIWAGDGGPDTFRIKIYTESATGEQVVYDNGTNLPIAGGNVVVHAPKRK